MGFPDLEMLGLGLLLALSSAGLQWFCHFLSLVPLPTWPCVRSQTHSVGCLRSSQSSSPVMSSDDVPMNDGGSQWGPIDFLWRM
ncbi:hypothetical protein BDP81DRAFT_121752 [Colletotrichum phormii]|uniref:Uncharacterized protein n=1 Tax=Colletotrichum phormii TaxID=359342 RepID=A0AAJ0EB79_9PEZI|nr:uncharacterized protein BDP81DRAFT_121752 [Colletotrichum phormii]KAK1623402.1 hypothetical protein BDP81DRAFT_121752 [Colletotrichum phormii]